MAKSTAKKRVKVKDLPAAKKKMSAGDMKKIKGGIDWSGPGDVINNPKKPPTIKP